MGMRGMLGKLGGLEEGGGRAVGGNLREPGGSLGSRPSPRLLLRPRTRYCRGINGLTRPGWGHAPTCAAGERGHGRARGNGKSLTPTTGTIFSPCRSHLPLTHPHGHPLPLTSPPRSRPKAVTSPSHTPSGHHPPRLPPHHRHFPSPAPHGHHFPLCRASHLTRRLPSCPAWRAHHKLHLTLLPVWTTLPIVPHGRLQLPSCPVRLSLISAYISHRTLHRRRLHRSLYFPSWFSHINTFFQPK